MYELGNGEGFLKGITDGDDYLISNTKEQISAFIMAFQGESETVITNMMDQTEITTLSGFINKCYNQTFLPVLLEILVPQQLGDVEAIPFVPYRADEKAPEIFWYDGYAFSEEFWTPYTDYKHKIGEKFHVVRRLTTDDCDKECLPQWIIRFEDGTEIQAYPEEIIEEVKKQKVSLQG